MNTKYILLSLAALLAACSESEDVLQNPEKAQLTISTEIVTTRASFNTGLLSDVEFKDGNQIGVTLLQNYVLYDKTYNHPAVYSKTGWSLADKVVLGEKAGTVVAYYPYTDTGYVYEGEKQLTTPIPMAVQHVNMDITSNPHGDGQQDYLWGKSVEDVSSTKPHARIQFQHVLPRITFKVTKGDENANDEIYVRQAFLKEADGIINRLGTKGKLDIGTGQATMDIDQQTTSLVNGYTAPIQIYPKEVTGEVRTFDFLVFPVTFKEGEVILSIETYKGKNGKLQTYDITLPAATWAAGKQYTYPVVVNIGGEQQQESKPGEKVYMGFNGDNGKPLYWSSWNLGASKPEDYGGLYGWGDPTGEHKEHFDQSYKDDPYYMTDSQKCLTYYGGTSPLESIAGTQYDIARVKWGDGWRIPSSNELWRLSSQCNDPEFITVNGVQGVRFTSKINGNTLFFPMAPIRVGNHYEQGSQTYYWLSHVNKDDKTMAGTFYLDMYWKNAWPTKGRIRYQGLPIRPVTE